MRLPWTLAFASIFVVVVLVLIHGAAPDTGTYFQVRQWVVGEDYTGLMPMNYRPPLIGVVLMGITRSFLPIWLAASGTIALLLGLLYFLVLDGEGPDYGSYLQTRNWITGQDFTGLMERHYRPLLVGVCLWPLAIPFGDVGAGRVMAIASLVGVVWASYFLALAWLTPTRAAWASGVFIVVAVPVTHNLIAGYLPVLALALSFVLIRLVITPSRASWWAVPLVSFLLAGFNQTLPVTMAVVFLMLPIWTRRQWGILLVGVVGALPWLPFALVSGAETFSFSAFDWPDWSLEGQARIGIARLGIEWGFAIVLVPAAIWLAVVQRQSPLTLPFAGSLALSLLVLTSVAVNNALARFALYVPMFLAIHLVLAYGDSVVSAGRYWKASVGLALVCIWMLHSATAVDNSHRYQVLTEERLAAIEYLGAVSNPTDHISSYPQNVGHWIGGVTGRLWSMPWQFSPPRLYREEVADLYCLLGISADSHVHLAWMNEYPPCTPDSPTRYRWIISDFGPPDRLWPRGTYPDPRPDPTEQGLDRPRLTEVKRYGPVGVYRVSGPYLPENGKVDRSKGRSWPWEGW